MGKFFVQVTNNKTVYFWIPIINELVEKYRYIAGKMGAKLPLPHLERQIC